MVGAIFNVIVFFLKKIYFVLANVRVIQIDGKQVLVFDNGTNSPVKP